MTTLSGFRLVTVRQGDTMQAIAARTLGDASRWRQLVWINGLVYPYIAASSSPGVVIPGALLKVPASSVQAATTVDPNLLFGIDLALVDGDLQADSSGDLAVVAGIANLEQALRHRVATPLGDLIWHQDYGNGVFRLIGGGNGPSDGLLSEQYVASCLRADPRVASIQSVKTIIAPDAITSMAIVNPIVGAPVTVSSQT